YFFTVADRLKIDVINKWASYFGLDRRTNIELTNEALGQIASPNVLYDPTLPLDKQISSRGILVYRAVKEEIKSAAEESDVEISDEKLSELADEIFKLVGQSNTVILNTVARLLTENTSIKRSIISNKTKFHIRDLLAEITWSPTDTLTTGIGQNLTSLTPIAVARYISAIVNGGYVYDAHIVSKIVDDEGNTVTEMVPNVYRNLNVNPEYLDLVKEGMSDVVSGDDSSTARKHFSGFEYVDMMGGKTGTAQVSSINLENNSWFVSFAPFDKPEIAVVVFIPNGYSGGMSSHTTKQIVKYYLDRKFSSNPAKINNSPFAN
ncbi:MAG TPA: penicillin-binding transpeptidase domain-containing protein, partial [Clostridia bacterium]|nr:penicillin-binding transpeptidase domain-containing protein [Clostridia bacterium]